MTKRLLFLCVANSARSQMAEGLARKILGSHWQVASGGSAPSGQIHPLAVQVMKEVGIDLHHQHSKNFQTLPKEFLDHVDYVITLCAEEECPITHLKAKKISWAMPDPAGQGSTEDEKLWAFRKARDLIQTKLEAFKVSH